MNKQKWVLFGMTVALIGASALVLSHLRANQRLAAPGVKILPIEGTNRFVAVLPETVLNYKSDWIDVDEVTYNTLPKDTTFGQRRYEAPDGFETTLNVVLMGRDRTSLHKPQFCLNGQGWAIDSGGTKADLIQIARPVHYDLPVVRLVATKEVTVDGQPRLARGVYVYWYVADDALSASASGFERMWSMARRLVRTGVLQRWAYISCFSVCVPGQEEATYERMKQFIAAAVPEFQLVPSALQASLREAPARTAQ